MEINEKRSDEFIKRVRKLGFMQTELGILLGKSARCISFYMTKTRNVPTVVWARLNDLEELPRERLCKIIAKAKNG